MGRTIVFNGQTLTIPEAYSVLNVDALLTPTAGGLGILAIVGESDGGAPGLNLIPGGASTTTIKKLLQSGPGADAARLALRSSQADPLVPAGASAVIFAQTNQSTRATSALSTKGTFTTKRYGLATNAYTAFTTNVSGGKVATIRENSSAAASIVEMSPVLGVVPYFTLTYTGTGTAATASFHYTSGVLRLQTTLTGQSGGEVNLDIDCTGLTVNQLVNRINTFTGYVAAVANQKGQVLAADLDLKVSAVSILTPTVLSFVASQKELTDWATTTSQLVTYARAAGDAGDTVPSPFPTAGVLGFTGGTRGASSNSDVQNALNLLLGMRVNWVVPLFSSDNQDGSTVTIAAVNSQVKDHVESRSSLLGRSEAQACVSIKGNKAAFIAECARMGSMFVSVTSEQFTDLDIDGNVKLFPEWAAAVVAAQTKCGSATGTPLENRILPIIGSTNDVSWNFIVDGAELLQKGALLTMVDENNQRRWKGGYTSWLGDDNNGRIFIETVESLIIFAFNHRRFMKQRFLGKSVYTPGDVLAAISESEKAERDDTKSIKDYDKTQTKLFSATAGKLEYNVAVVPWEGIRFILPTILATRSAA